MATRKGGRWAFSRPVVLWRTLSGSNHWTLIHSRPNPNIIPTLCGYVRAMSKREWSASDQIQRHGDEAICSCPALCLIGDGGNPTSHGVCRHIDDRGIDGDSISRGVGGLDDNSVDGDSVSGSVGSLKQWRPGKEGDGHSPALLSCGEHCRGATMPLPLTSLLLGFERYTVRQTKVWESLDNVITFHVMKCTTDGCNGPCNQDNKSDVDALYDSDDSCMSSSGDSSWSGTLSDDLDNWDVDEVDNVLHSRRQCFQFL